VIEYGDDGRELGRYALWRDDEAARAWVTDEATERSGA
jgi:hypothetical protein